MKKITILLAITLLLSLTACGEQDKENDFYEVIDVDKQKLTAIQAYYEWGESTYSMTMLEGTNDFEMFMKYFDCEVEEVEIPMDAYEVDPVSFIFEIGDQKVETYFITAEEGNGNGQTLYLVQNEKVYRLLRNLDDGI